MHRGIRASVKLNFGCDRTVQPIICFLAQSQQLYPHLTTCLWLKRKVTKNKPITLVLFEWRGKGRGALSLSASLEDRAPNGVRLPAATVGLLIENASKCLSFELCALKADASSSALFLTFVKFLFLSVEIEYMCYF